MQQPPPKSAHLRGTKLLSLLGHVLVTIQKQGLFKALSYFVAGWLLWALNLAWKARRVWYWAWSPRVPEDELVARNAACATCERRKIKAPPSGFFRWSVLGFDLFPGGAFCAECGCWDWFLALLRIKNTREGHVCPLGLHPGQKPMPQRKAGGCQGCGGSKRTNNVRGPGVAPGSPIARVQGMDTRIPPRESGLILPFAAS